MSTRRILLGMLLLPLFACGEAEQDDSTIAVDTNCLDEAEGAGADTVLPIERVCRTRNDLQWQLRNSGDAAKTNASGGTVLYSVDSTTIFANPERGFYHHEETDGTSPLSQSQLTSYRTSESVSLILRLFYLDAFRSGSISASYLASMTTDFTRLRAAGLKAVVRFAYTSSMDKPYGDATKARVLAHIAQLAPILQANADVIATVQAGLVGAWGEWYYTDNFGDQGSISAAQLSDRKAVVDALLAALPPNRTVQLRTPSFKKSFYGSSALSASEAFATSARARVGHHNDCFLASADDEGTYGNVASDKAFLATDNLYVPQGGETCATSSFSKWANASADLEQLHYSFLNRDYLSAVYTSWGSNIDIARRRLGYRLALVDGTFGGDARPGAEFAVTLHVRNDGYAPPFNPRGLELVARHQTTGARIVAKLAADPRKFAPGTTQTISARVCVPVGTPSGTYSLSLSLPDPEPTLRNRPEYAIRLANTGLWNATTGENSLKQNLVVTSSSSAPTCSAASIALN